MPNLKLITTRSTGFDHIDLTECRRRGILIANVPHYGEDTVAEHAFGMLLALNHPEDYKAMLQNARFRCQNCGRTATSDNNLCSPVAL